MSDELPEWVQFLVTAAEEEAYTRGWEEGQAALWYNIEQELRTVRPYSA